MSTRKLIALALACGLAILLAGGIQLFLVARQDQSARRFLSEGDAAVVGGATAMVVSHQVDSGKSVAVTVELRAGDSPIASAEQGWLLNRNGKLVDRVAADPASGVPACRGQVVEAKATLRCVVAFAAPEGSGSLFVVYGSGTQRASWELSA